MKRIYNRKTGKGMKVAGSTDIPYVELPNGVKLFTLTSAVTTSVTTDSPAAVTGDLAVTTNATGRGKLFTSNGTVWVDVGGQPLQQGVGVADPAALTSAQITGGESPTETEYNNLQTDVAALRTKLIAVISSLEGSGALATA